MIIKTAAEVKIVLTVEIKTHIKMTIKQRLTIVLNVFGKEGGEIMNVHVLKIKVETVTDKIFMEALGIPIINFLLSNQNSQYVLSQSYLHL